MTENSHKKRRVEVKVEVEKGSDMKATAAFLVLALIVACSGPGHGEAVDSGHPVAEDAPALQERLGENLPPDLTFSDEEGRALRLGDQLGRPAILSLVYFTCTHVCPQVLGGLAEALGRMDLVPGRDYRVVTVSFDDADTPELARRAKSNYLRATDRSLPEESWRFLTGDRSSIGRLTSALGFTFRKEGHGIIHPAVLVILSPEGKITKYIHVEKFRYGVAYPVTFSPVELASSLGEAGQGRVGVSPARPGLFCFPHEPEGQAGFFRLLAAVGAATLLGMAGLFVYLKATSVKRHGEG